MRMRLVSIAVAGLGLGAGSPALAQTPAPLQVFERACASHPGQTLPAGDVLAILLESNGAAWSFSLVQAYQRTVNGDAFGGAGPTLADRELGALAGALSFDLLEIISVAELRPLQSRIVAIVRPGSGQPAQAAEAYLNGQLDVINIHCPVPTQRVSDSPSDDGSNGRPVAPRPLIVAGDVASLSQSALGDRTFATLSYVDNRETGAESIDVNLVAGLGVFEHGALRWVPYVAYQRQTSASSPINDLTLGLTGFWRGDYHQIRWTAAYETDDEFQSALYTAEVEWTPPALQLCRQWVRYPARLTCQYGLRLDYVQVEDPGEKASLLSVNEYFRAGGWFNFNYGQGFSGGWLEAELDYHLMEPLNGEVGDAARGRVSVSYAPGATSHYRIGLAYENGEDPSSLVRSEILKVTLGFRY